MAIWKIAAAGLESRDHALLETTVDLAAGIETGRWEVVSEQTSAHVILANMESTEGQALLQQAPSETSALIVPYTVAETEDIKGLVLIEPLSYRSITSLLKKLESKLHSRKRVKPTPVVKLVESAELEPTELEPTELESAELESTEMVESVQESFIEHDDTQLVEQHANLMQEISNPDQIEEISSVDIIKHRIDWFADDETEEFENEPLISEVIASNDLEMEQQSSSKIFIPNTRLLGLIFNCIESGQTTQISHANYPVLRIFPENGWFIFSEELDSYPEMFREPAEFFMLEILDDEIKDELFSGRLPQSLWKLLFTAALFGSEGRLLENLDRDKPFHLLHTPYFGMIPHTADHVTTADFMVNHHKNLEAINQEINVDIETLIDFCNACDAIELLRNEDIRKDEQVQISTEHEELDALENDTTIESEIIRESPQAKKSGLINSLWSNLTKTS